MITLLTDQLTPCFRVFLKTWIIIQPGKKFHCVMESYLPKHSAGILCYSSAASPQIRAKFLENPFPSLMLALSRYLSHTGCKKRTRSLHIPLTATSNCIIVVNRVVKPIIRIDGSVICGCAVQ